MLVLTRSYIPYVRTLVQMFPFHETHNKYEADGRGLKKLEEGRRGHAVTRRVLTVSFCHLGLLVSTPVTFLTAMEAEADRIIDFEETMGDDTPTNPNRDCWVVFVCRATACPDHRSHHRLILCIEKTTGALKHLASSDLRQAAVLEVLRTKARQSKFGTTTRQGLRAAIEAVLKPTLVDQVMASGRTRTKDAAWVGFLRHFNPMTTYHFDDTSDLKYVIAETHVEPGHYDFHLDALFFDEVASCKGKN